MTSPACSCPSLAQQLRAALDEVPLLPCPVHTDQPTGAPALALNDDAALARALGMTLNRSRHFEGGDPPPAAA